MYEVVRYQDTNIGGTTVLIESLFASKRSQVSELVIASSRAVYGEGKYRCREHGVVYPGKRLTVDLLANEYEPVCPICKAPCSPEPTTEDSPAHPLSFYALTKWVQEEILHMFAKGISAHVLRYQNVYGPGQSLHNPYTGILAIFAALTRSNSPIEVFEDGQESRDFVYIDDAVEATWRALNHHQDAVEVFNVGSGIPTTVLQVAKEIVQFFGSSAGILVTGAFREGDIRHNFADLSRIRQTIGFTPRYSFPQGLQIFLDWVSERTSSSPAQYQSALQEIRERGLLRGGRERPAG